MQAEILENGNLKITADQEERDGILEHYAEAGKGFPGADIDILEELRLAGYENVAPEWIGALTAAPILTETESLEYPDDFDIMPTVNGVVWWYPDYAVLDPWEELAKDGEVVFQAAPVED
jgi:hypothetical protein